MICVSLIEKSPEKILSLIKHYPFAEIRLEYLEHSDVKSIHSIFSSHENLIATYRGLSSENPSKEKILTTAIQSGAAFVDIEIEESEEYKTSILNTAKDNKCKSIISYHNYENTPDITALKTLLNSCYKYDVDIIKIACQSNSLSDTARLLGLYENSENLIALSMGAHGSISRITSLFLGAPFTFSFPDNGAETAPGQVPYSKLNSILKMIKDK